MARHVCCIVILCVIGLALATPGEYVPKAYYYLDQFGHPSEIIYLRTRRSAELWPIFTKSRSKRSTDFDDLAEYSPSDSSSISGGKDKRQNANKDQISNKGPLLFSRTGQAVGKGVRVAGVASGINGAFSSSSSSIDSSGKIDYSVKTGRY